MKRPIKFTINPKRPKRRGMPTPPTKVIKDKKSTYSRKKKHKDAYEL
jgi:hypothetical protein